MLMLVTVTVAPLAVPFKYNVPVGKLSAFVPTPVANTLVVKSTVTD